MRACFFFFGHKPLSNAEAGGKPIISSFFILCSQVVPGRGFKRISNVPCCWRRMHRLVCAMTFEMTTMEAFASGLGVDLAGHEC